MSIKRGRHMKLKDLLEGFSYNILNGSVETDINKLEYDSRKVTKGDVFVCIKGAKSDGHRFISDVIAQGAAAIVVNKGSMAGKEESSADKDGATTIVESDDTRDALACMSAAFFGNPARRLKTIGITGTKGKTTTTYMIKSILENAGIKTGLIGTIESTYGDVSIPADNTTPESYIIQKTFKEMADAGMECVVMEVSSQGLMLKRVGGFTFDYGIFTNLEPDHIGPDEHKDFEDYKRCKAKLFRQCRVGIVNGDDLHVNEILEGHTCEVEIFGMGKESDLCAKDTKLIRGAGYLGVAYRLTGKMDMDVEIDFPGEFSVYNSLAAISICRHFNVPEGDIKNALKAVKVKGRVELLRVSDKYTMMIDYAHNAMSLESLLTTLKTYEPKRLVCMFGCGGNRSKLRRYEMGEVSSRLADLTVITSDNPRNEEPMDIIEDILTGVKREKGEFVTIPDRKEAIRYCMENAREGDVIVLAGKGHEDYQEIKGKKYPMDERILVKEILEER